MAAPRAGILLTQRQFRRLNTCNLTSAAAAAASGEKKIWQVLYGRRSGSRRHRKIRRRLTRAPDERKLGH